jgi:hypothetical protein
MNQPDTKKSTHLYPIKPEGKKDQMLKSIYSDRRSGNDRRKSYSADYFINGGIERRSWNERRYLWYMTD